MTQVCKPSRSPRHAAGKAGPLDTLLDPELFKALGDPTRVRLLACLAKCSRPCSVSEIAECCSVDLSVVSRHLGLLEDAGVLVSAKSGRTVTYSVRYSDLSQLLRNLADAFESFSACGTDCSTDCCTSCTPVQMSARNPAKKPRGTSNRKETR